MNKKKIILILVVIISVINILKCVLSGAAFDGTSYVIEVMGLNFPIFTVYYLSALITDMFPILVFQIIFGIFIYRRYCTGSVYYFCRQNNRKLWFLKEVIKLFAYTLCYFFFYLSVSYIAGMLICTKGTDFSGLREMINVMILFSLYTMLFTLLLNICSIVAGSQSAYLLMFGIQILMTLSMLIFDNENIFEKFVLLFKLNPVANIVLAWHSTGYGDITLPAEKLGVDFTFLFSAIYLAVLLFIAVAVGTVIADKHDIALDNKEEQG